MEAQMVRDQAEANRRAERRQRVYKHARIIFNNGYAVFDCLVRNISGGGAMLEMETLLGIPRAFQIVLDHDAKARPCRVIWRTDRRMGVAFADLQAAG
jgi:hypothetical protein